MKKLLTLIFLSSTFAGFQVNAMSTCTCPLAGGGSANCGGTVNNNCGGTSTCGSAGWSITCNPPKNSTISKNSQNIVSAILTGQSTNFVAPAANVIGNKVNNSKVGY